MDTPESASLLRRTARRLWTAFPWLVLGWVALGALLRLTVRDRLTGLGFVVYANPPIVMALLLLPAGAALAARRWPRTLGALLAAFVLCLFWHRSHAYVTPSGAVRPSNRGIGVVTWNAGRGHAGWDAVAGHLEELRAYPVIALQEAGTDEPDRRAFWAERFPDRERAFFGSGLVLLVRGRIVRSRKIDLQADAKCALVEVLVGGRTLHVLLLDVKRLALTPRDTVFEKLDATIAAIDERPLVVLGDFNTPRDSAFFDSWRTRFDHTFEVSGRGHDATWPLLFPVLAIDHIWHSRDLETVTCILRRDAPSDHASVTAVVEFRE